MGGGPAVISGHYAFLPGANIYDISDPGTPVFMSYIGAALDIAVLDHYAYLVTTGDSSGTNGFYVFDFSNPASPTNVAVMGASGSLITIAGNYAYVMAYGRGGGNIKILDISNRTNPVLVNTISAWIYGMTSSGNYLYLVAGSLDIYDVSNPTNTLKAASVGLGFNSQGYAITVSRNYAYIAQTDRIAIYDLGRPAPPQLSINPTSTNTTFSARSRHTVPSC